MTSCAFFLHSMGTEQLVKSFKSCFVDADDQLMHSNFPKGWEGANILCCSIALQHFMAGFSLKPEDCSKFVSWNLHGKKIFWYILHSIPSVAWSWVLLKCEHFLTRKLASAQCLQQLDVSTCKSWGKQYSSIEQGSGHKGYVYLEEILLDWYVGRCWYRDEQRYYDTPCVGIPIWKWINLLQQKTW